MKYDVLDELTDIGRKLGLGKIPGVKRFYSWLYSNLAANWSESNEIETVEVEHEGYKLLKHPKYEHKTREPEVRDYLYNNTSAGDTVVDIGAHQGVHTLSLRRFVGSSGTVISFEPIPYWANGIRKTVEANSFENVRVEQKAISETTGEVTISIDRPVTSQASITTESETGTSISVKSIQLGDYLRDSGLSRVNVAKIDIEGGEYNVLCESDALEYIETLVVELHPHKIGHNKSKHIFDSLENKGEITDLEGSKIGIEDIEMDGPVHIAWCCFSNTDL